MNFIKLLATLCVICLSNNLLSQDFTTKIKDNALIVFSLNSGNILKKVPEEKINVSQVFYELKKELRLDELQNLTDLGFEFNSSMIYALEVDSNMMYNLFFMPIKDLAKFESLVNSKANNKIAAQKEGYKSLSNKRKTEHVVWNSDFAVFAFGEYTGRQYAYKYYSSSSDYNYYEENRAIEKVLFEDSTNSLTIKQKSDKVDELINSKFKLSDFENSEEIPVEQASNEVENKLEEGAAKAEIAEVESTEVEEAMDAVEVVEAPSYRSYRNNNYYNNLYEKKKEIRNYRRDIRNTIRSNKEKIREAKKAELVEQLFNTRFNTIFNQDIASSINSVATFSKSKDKKADGVLWMRNDYLQNGMKSMMTSIFGYGYWGRRSSRTGILGNTFSQFGDDVSVTKLYFEKKGVRFTKESDNDKESVNSTNAIFSTKQDSRFLKYVNDDNFIGYISSSLSSEAAIRELPHLWSNAYKQYSSKHNEEMDVLADIIEVFMDEKAIGELASGNAFFVLKDMKPKEVNYTTYEYDENYKRTKVEKTKTELLPEFLFMVSTENESLLTRILKLGIKNEVISQSGKYYTTKTKQSKLPMDLFFAIKDGIVFLTTDEIEIQSIIAGGTSVGITKKHRKIIEKNSQVVYFDSKKLVNYFPDKTVRRREVEEFKYFKENGFEEVLITTQNQRGNLYTDGYFNTPEGENNSAMYVFEFINQFIEISKH